MDLSRRDFLASGTLAAGASLTGGSAAAAPVVLAQAGPAPRGFDPADAALKYDLVIANRSEEHTSELQSHHELVCRLLLEKKKDCSDSTSRSITAPCSRTGT